MARYGKAIACLAATAAVASARLSRTEEDNTQLNVDATPEDLFGLLGIFPLGLFDKKAPEEEESKSKGKGKRALKRTDAEKDEITAAFNELSTDDRKRALELAEAGNKEELFGLLGIFPLGLFFKAPEEEESKSKGKGKRALTAKATPEDLFGLLGVFPLGLFFKAPEEEESKSKGKGKRALKVADDSTAEKQVITAAFNELSADNRKRALELAEAGNKEELFGLLGIFPLGLFFKAPEEEESKSKGKGKRALTAKATPEDLFGLLGVFPLGLFDKKAPEEEESKSKGKGKGKRALKVADDSTAEKQVITAAFNVLSTDNRKLALELAEAGNKEELFGLLGIFPLGLFDKKAPEEESKSKGKGKRAV